MEVPDLGPYAQRDWPEAQKGHAAMITRMDRDIGRLLDLLKQHGIDDRTLVLFSSDNGPHREGGNDPEFADSNGPLRGIKRDLYEGGIRVPMLARWPGTIPAGVVSDHVGYFPDVLPTLAEAAGAKSPKEIDGISFLPALRGESGKQKQHDYLYWEFYERGAAQAVRMGDWKAVCKPFWGPVELYNLKEDVSEERNVAEGHPKIVEKVRAAMKEAHVPSPLWKIRDRR
jgi:arylsulfatase A-like enzyme